MQDFEKTEWKASDMCIYMHNYVHVIHIYTILLSLFIGSSYWPFWNEPTPLNRLSIKTGFCSPAMTAAAAAKSLQSCPTLCDPRDGSPPGSLSLGFSRQEHWSGLPFPSPMHESEKWKWEVKVKSLSRVRLLVTPWTAAHQAPASMGFSRQEYWSGVPLPSPLQWLVFF